MKKHGVTAAAILCAGQLALAQVTTLDSGNTAQKPNSAAPPRSEPAEMTFEGCLYENSRTATSSPRDGVSGEQTTLYVLADVKHAAEQPKPRAAGETQKDAPVGTAGGNAPRDEPDPRMRIIFTNDTAAKPLVGRRVTVTGRTSAATTDGGSAASPSAPGVSTEQKSAVSHTDTAAIPEFHASSIQAAEGTCAPTAALEN